MSWSRAVLLFAAASVLALRAAQSSGYQSDNGGRRPDRAHGEDAGPPRLGVRSAGAGPRHLGVRPAGAGPRHLGVRPAGGGFAVEPYLLDVTAGAATVAFHLKTPAAAEVLVRGGPPSPRLRRAMPSAASAKEGGAGSVRFASEEERESHFVRVTGLAPGRTYTYEVACAQGGPRTPEGDGSYAIRTACLPGESFTFAVYGDTRPGENLTDRHHREVVAQIVRAEPSFCLILGDMVDDGSDPRLWEDFFRVESPLLRRASAFPVAGDNDWARGRGRHAEYFPRLRRGRPSPGSRPPPSEASAEEGGYYGFEWGGVHFFGLNAWDTRGAQPREELDAESEQLKWLDAQLARDEVRRAAFRVLFLHDPVYICRGRSSELLRRVWAPVFEKRGVDVVFASWHLYERSHHRGVTYVISGGAGAELIWMPRNPDSPSQAEAKRHHFCRVDVRAGSLTVRAVASDGTVLDSITLAPRPSGADGESAIERAARRLVRTINIPASADAPVMTLYLFSYDCAYCRRLLRNDLPRWAAEHGASMRVRYYDLGLRGVYDLLVAAGADFGRQGADIPAIFVGRRVLGGEREIGEGLPREIREFLDDPLRYRERAHVPFTRAHDTKAMREEAFGTLTLAVVLGAGLLDGVNPCAFTAVIFLVSYLSMAGGTRRQMLVTGGLFTLAVFLTYLAIGFLFFQLTRFVLGHGIAATVVNSLLLVLLAVLAGLSLVDFVRCLKGRAVDISLQLPRFLKDRIRGRIRDFARNRLALGSASFGLGVVIAAMELACTGQVYVPIVTMISEPRHRAAASLYLVAYNVAFVLPLAAVFLLAAFGVTSQRTAGFFGRRVALVKLGLALLFVAMGLAIAHNMGLLP